MGDVLGAPSQARLCQPAADAGPGSHGEVPGSVGVDLLKNREGHVTRVKRQDSGELTVAGLDAVRDLRE